MLLHTAGATSRQARPGLAETGDGTGEARPLGRHGQAVTRGADSEPLARIVPRRAARASPTLALVDACQLHFGGVPPPDLTLAATLESLLVDLKASRKSTSPCPLFRETVGTSKGFQVPQPIRA